MRETALENQLQSLCMARALKKVKTPLATLKRDAIDALKQAGHWGDEVGVAIRLATTHRAARRQRLLHGIPSPRYGYVAGQYEMAAVDVLHFFGGNRAQRSALYQEAMPTFATLECLEAWLSHFSSRRFQRDLVDALFAQAEVYLSDPFYRSGILTPAVWLRMVAVDAAEIDRYAWAQGYRTLNLAKSAAVWSPPRSHRQAANRRTKW
ncbi:hypothetical protein BUE93_20225 [Chromobacterium amazonense]|uniref:Uncharacterized protein n=2 Tax=Chromobacterium amazonense TaxID=1382803 RepID=A0A2S9WZ88_9NEIS|nr:hypothetical protein BUE93_20225 [Chromobacterium amazonense]